jgi:hypothetical protein
MAEDKKVVTKKTATKKAAVAKKAPAAAAQPLIKKTVAKKTLAKKVVSKKAPTAAPAAPAAPVAKKAVAKKTAAKKTVAKKAAVPKTAPQPPLPDRAVTLKPVSEVTPEERYRMIEEAAYYRAEKRGFAPGQEHEDWAAAVAEIDAMLGRDDHGD